MSITNIDEMAPPITVRQHSPRTALKLWRNHFDSGSERLYDPSKRSINYRGVSTTKPIGTAHRAIQKRYRFNRVNAVFNPRKCLVGDDPTLLDNRPDGARNWTVE